MKQREAGGLEPLEDQFAVPDSLREPFDYLADLRLRAPAFYSAALDGFIVTRLDEVQRILGEPKTFSSTPVASPTAMALHAAEYLHIYEEMGACPPLPTLLVTDGDVHRRYRNAVKGAFSTKSVRRMDESIRAIADLLIDRFIDQGRVDLYAEFCLKLPSYLICDLVGFPREQADQLKRWADTSGRLTGSALESEEERARLHRDRAEMHLYFKSLVDYYREAPSDTLISELTHAMPSDGIPFSDQEIVSMLATLNVAGNETTTNGLGGMFYTAVREPGLMPQLRDDPRKIGHLVEEALRLESPVSAMLRWVTEDTQVAGVAIPAGSRLYISFLSANHDERAFPCPEAVDLARSGIRNHLAFGGGPHFCLGAMLARSAMNISMDRVLHRLSDLRVDDDAKPLEHSGKLVFRSLVSLPVVFSAAT